MSELTSEERRDKRKKAYYNLTHDIYMMKCKMKDIEKHRGHSPAFKNLMAALDVFEDQLTRDYERYEKRIRESSATKEIKQMQDSLNRERKLRNELEVKIKEASESSGLFIKYVREKLKL